MLFRRVLAAQLKRPKSSLVTANAVQHFQDIPAPKSLPLIGTTLNIILEGSSEKLHKYVDKRHRQLGPIYREDLGPVSCVFISDPEEIRAVYAQEGKYPMHVMPEAWIVYNRLYGCRRGLFFMDGTTWWYHRRIINRHLLKGDLKWIEDSCEYVSDKLINQLHRTSSDTYYESLESTLYKWSLEVIVSILLGTETYAKHSTALHEDIDKLSRIVHLVFKTSAKLALIPASFASKFRIPRWNRFVEAVDGALDGANLLVDKMTAILDPKSEGLLPKLLNEEIERENIRRIIVDLILAAGDTSTHAMKWLLYVVGKYKDTQEELRRDHGYVKHVFRETLRLYPVVPFLTRILPEDSTLCGYGVPKGTLIVLSMYTSGRDERYFKNPESFEPKRWIRQDNEDYNVGMQKATLPFAIGLRSCVGRKIAETQIFTTLLKIVDNFDVVIGNDKNVDIVLKMVAVPSEPLKLKFNKL